MVQEIHIALEDQIRNPAAENIANFNTCAHNMPMLSGYEIFIIYPIALIGMVILVLTINFRSEHVQQNIIFVEVILEYIVGVMIPVYILMKKPVIRNHLWDEIRNQC